MNRALGKIFAVAEAEFRSLVRSKAFIVSILILPAMILVMSFAQTQLAGRVDTSPRRFAVVDGSGRFWDVIAQKAREHNAHLGELDGKRVARAPFEPTRASDGKPLEQLRVELSDRVRKEELFAFV
ncbi:MAG TPA: hypothetical protein VH138_00215, partial [Vicinamibacterales bacterium]|nr:hypothetical protein [Vicinamibacterales bacterium]